MNEIRITIEGLKELTEAVKMLAGQQGGQTAVQTVSQQIPRPAPDPAPAVQSGAIPQGVPVAPVQPQQPAGFPVPGGMVPTTAVAPGYSLEQLQVAAAGLTSMGRMPQVMGILQQFGIQAMTELPKERYGEFATALREAGAQI